MIVCMFGSGGSEFECEAVQKVEKPMFFGGNDCAKVGHNVGLRQSRTQCQADV
jgi:hypothetical protein